MLPVHQTPCSVALSISIPLWTLCFFFFYCTEGFSTLNAEDLYSNIFKDFFQKLILSSFKAVFFFFSFNAVLFYLGHAMVLSCPVSTKNNRFSLYCVNFDELPAAAQTLRLGCSLIVG